MSALPEPGSEEYEEAKRKLGRAIAEFQNTIDPEVFVDAWVVLTHKESAEWAQKNQSTVGILVPTGQRFIVTTGIIEEARKVV